MTTATDTKLTLAEAAYAHLASFQRGDTATVTGKAWALPEGPVTVTTPQRHDFSHILRSDLTVTDASGAEFTITVANLLSGRYAITSPVAAKTATP